MKLSSRLVSLCQQGIIDSMSVDLMVSFVRQIIQNYDLNKQTGIPDSIPIPKKDAAHQIMSDIKDERLLLEFVNLLVRTHLEGYMGRTYNISNIRQILREMQNQGYIFDQEYKMFIENSDVQRTPNWGVLRDGIEYPLTFLRLDIAGNSAIVRDNHGTTVETAYTELRRIVETAVEKRNGRIWNWEGDGVLAAFYFSKKDMNATLAAMEITHELYIFNAMRCSLKTPLNVRIAIHSGLCNYSSNMDVIKKSDTIKKTIELESTCTPLNTVTISGSAGQHFSDVLLARLDKTIASGSVKYYNYSLKWIKQ
jgi:hypothetical protein